MKILILNYSSVLNFNENVPDGTESYDVCV